MVETVVTLGKVLESLKQNGDKFQIGSFALAGTNTAANYPVACTNDFTAQTRRQISMQRGHAAHSLAFENQSVHV
jgi:hypothetical protein